MRFQIPTKEAIALLKESCEYHGIHEDVGWVIVPNGGLLLKDGSKLVTINGKFYHITYP